MIRATVSGGIPIAPAPTALIPVTISVTVSTTSQPSVRRRRAATPSGSC